MLGYVTMWGQGEGGRVCEGRDREGGGGWGEGGGEVNLDDTQQQDSGIQLFAAFANQLSVSTGMQCHMYLFPNFQTWHGSL